MRLFFLSILTISALTAISQQKPTLNFLNDSVLIGEPTPISFSYHHKSDLEVLFPDSTFSFSPFEFERKAIFTTKTDSLSKDSCIYWLSTFELDKIQTLKLPVFVFNKKDSIPVYSNIDTIILTEVITVVSDTLQIKENVDYQNVETNFNSILFIIVFGSIIIILSVLGILFRKKIILFFKVRKLKKSYEKFTSDYKSSITNYESSKDVKTLESLITVWKSYVEKTTGIPLTKLSTKEIQQSIDNPAIIELLKTVDGEVFGGIKSPNYNFKSLEEYANAMFNQKMNELQND